MTPELQKYYEDRFDLMLTQGWVDLIDDVSKMKEVYDNLLNINSLEDLHMRKGQLDILNWILTLKQVSEQAYEGLQDEDVI